MKKEELAITTSFKDFIEINQLNDVELQYMCDSIIQEQAQPLFRFMPANNQPDKKILVYEPNNYGLLLTEKAYNYFITWFEKEYCNKEMYDAYLSWKAAVEKND